MSSVTESNDLTSKYKLQTSYVQLFHNLYLDDSS